MKFTTQIAVKNMKRRPLRASLMALLVLLLAFTLFAGAFTVLSLQRGLASYQDRLGADVVVVPASTRGHGSVDDIFLQGITGNYYMSAKDCDRVRSTEGIEACSEQFFLTSAKASCCSTRVQIIGFDPETDFTVQPWVEETYTEEIGDGDVIAGANLNVPADRIITFYGEEYHVVAQLAKTGTGLDSAVYTNMNTIKQMAHDAVTLLKTKAFEGVDIDTAASAIMIRVADGYTIQQVTDDINIHVTKVDASSARSMISDISSGLGNISRVIGALVAAIWILAVIIMIAVFAMLANERKKEFAVLRVVGASRGMLSRVMSTEAMLVSLAGAIPGLLLGLAVCLLLSGTLKDVLGLPLLTPGAGSVCVLVLGALIISVLAGLLTSWVSARKITGSDTALLLREDA